MHDHYNPKAKVYSPTRHMFPRSVLSPSRITFVAAAFLLLLFFHLKSATQIPVSQAWYDAKGRLFTTGHSGPPPGFRPLNQSKIAIVTFSTDQKSYTHLSLKNKAYYAKKHGYDFFVDFEQHNPRGVMWSKFDMVQRVTNTSKYDWVWWMDFDTLITNTNIKLESVIEESLVAANRTNPDLIDWIFTPDCFQLNAGSFLARTTPRLNTFINAVIDYHENNSKGDHQLSEQDCIRDVIFKEKLFADNTLFIPQYKINAFPEEIKCYDQTKKKWEQGTFALHFAGAWAHVRDIEDPTGFLMTKYEKYIQW